MSRSRAIRLALALTVLAAAGVCLRGYITDDTFIHLRYAENLAQRGEYSFNPGEPTYGATSPLWILGLVLLLEFGVPPLLAPWLLGALTGAACLLLADAILARLSLPQSWRSVILLLIAADAWFLRWTFSGMETPLITALLLVLLLPLAGARGTPGRVGHLAWGAAAGLAGLTRPEFLVAAPLAWPWLWWAGGGSRGACLETSRGATRETAGRDPAPRRSAMWCLLAAAGGWILVVGPWLAYAWSTFGRLLPGTASAKSSALTHAPSALAGSLVQSAQVLAATQGLVWLALAALLLVWSAARRHGGTPPAPQSGGWTRGERALLGAVSTWAVVLIGGYAAKQVWVISRYLCPLAPGLLLALGPAARHLWVAVAGRGPASRLGAAALLAGAVLTPVVNGAIFLDQVVPHARSFSAGVRSCYLELGAWLGANTAPDAVVAALDIGAVGYAGGRPVLDLMGLVSPEVLTLGSRMGFQEMVAGGAWVALACPQPGGPPAYFVDRTEGPPRWQGREILGVRFELLDTCTIAGVGLREPQPWTVALYRLMPSLTRTSPSAGG